MREADPIGVFDSGIGGLTVVRELWRQLPSERIVYFGDTARVPYGPKSPDTVRRYSLEIAAFLLEQGVKAIVVACNTATAHALPALRQQLPVPVVGVIGPGARAAVAATRTGVIGVIGTAGTVGSGAYDAAIHELAPEARITAVACPLFVPLVEEGWLDTAATRLIAESYLRPLADGALDTLVLGCTHYPLLKSVIGQAMGSGVRLIDSAEQTAREVGALLGGEALLAPETRIVQHRFIVSDAASHFRRVSGQFLGAPLECVETLSLG